MHNFLSFCKILELLGEDSTTMIADLPAELDVNVESAMRHCMAVAHIANQNHRDLLVKNAQKVRTNENIKGCALYWSQIKKRNGLILLFSNNCKKKKNVGKQ